MLTDVNAARERLRVLDLEYEVTSKLIVAIEAYQQAVAGSMLPRKSGGSASYRGIKGRATAQIARIADELIERTGKPVPTRKIMEEMQKRGIAIPEKNAMNTLSARLSVVPHLKGRRDQGWWPIVRPWPDNLAIAMSEQRSSKAAG